MERGFNIETTSGLQVRIVQKQTDAVYGELFLGEDGVLYKRSHGLKFEVCERQPEGVEAAQEAYVAAAAASKVEESGEVLTEDGPGGVEVEQPAGAVDLQALRSRFEEDELADVEVADLTEDELVEAFAVDVDAEVGAELPDADVIAEDDTL